MSTTTASSISLEPVVLSPCWNLEEVERLLRKYPLLLDRYDYGTAGFRYPSHVLDPVMVRVGIVATLFAATYCSSSQSQSQSVGVMVTASHNTEEYNGVKLSASNGGMMSSEGEEMAVKYANAPVEAVLDWITTKRTLNNSAVRVHVGCDTRESSPSLTCLLTRTIRAMGGTVVNHGVVTTPQLHHCVLHDNYHTVIAQNVIIPHSPNVRGYFALLASSYLELLGGGGGGGGETTITANGEPTTTAQRRRRTLVVDCACGVGYPHLHHLINNHLQLDASSSAQELPRIVCANTPGSGPLNEDCGSEHVQKTQAPPKWYDLDLESEHDDLFEYCAALDGDADRIVFFSSSCDDKSCQSDSSLSSFTLLDGDKIACLCCAFLQEQLDAIQQQLGIQQQLQLQLPKLGVVQTAYANGASTLYLKRHIFNNDKGNNDDDSDKVKIAKTGVKHVHAVAHQEFDIGVYFESNGHGTILFGPAFYDFVEGAEEALTLSMVSDPHDQTTTTSSSRTAAGLALKRLKVLPSLVNQAVGDALSDLLLVDAILQFRNWTLKDWMNMYTDFPSRQVKVKVADRTVIKTNDNETRCLEPVAVQRALDAAMQKYEGFGRTFVRPSGTEDVVRVYAEAPTQEQADALAQEAVEIVQRHCGGVNDDSSFPPASKM